VHRGQPHVITTEQQHTQTMNDAQSTLNNDVEITGSITFKGALIFDGSLKSGEIKGGDLTLGPKARVEGNIESGSLTVHGSVSGDVLVSARCHLTAAAKLIGGLTTNRLVMDDGATFIGRAEITPEGKKPTPLQSK
jgi:cytoskeletal protein CcmA (bactofilin family)